MPSNVSSAPCSRSNCSLAISLLMIVVGMVMLSYAAVPLYKLFCQVTGFGGTTQRGQTAPDIILARQMTVSFNTDTDPNLPWRFKALQLDTKVKIGESVLAVFEAENQSDQPVTGMATYNVTPFEAGPYFHKVQCFCFEEQTLAPGQTVQMPISFYIDPALDEDPFLDGVKNITLSYTFFNQSSKNN